jgi:sulfofructose kinase
MEKPMPTVVCIGIAVWDVVFQSGTPLQRDAKTYALSRTEVTGGIGANGARTVARLGGRAVLGSRIGSDLAAQGILAELGQEGIDTTGVYLVPGARTSYSAVIIEPTGERTLINDTDQRTLHGREGVPLAAIDRADAVMVDTRWVDGAEMAVLRAAERGIPSVLDFDCVPEGGRTEILFRHASHVVFGGQGLAAFAGTQDPAHGLLHVRPQTAGWLAVTAGDNGLFWLDGSEVRHLPGFPVAAVDTLAAGDIWHGAFALGLAQGRPAIDAARFAHAAAALKCMRPGGGAGAPYRDELDTFLRERS